MNRHFILTFLCLLCIHAVAQEKLTVHVTNKKTKEVLELVLISSNNNWLGSTDSAGYANVTAPAGKHTLSFTLTGYEKYDTTIVLPGISVLNVTLQQNETALEEVTVVASTRTNQAIENSPMKVEVLGLEEVSEEASIKPGNIASILGDVSGVQIQQSSVTSGNSNVRIQGLDGRYTQILRDGMPLYDGFSGGFGILSVPPLDLKQIELIKGSASTLYGGGAIGGLINLISKRPTFKQELDAVVNYTTLKEFNANVYLSKRNKKFGYNLFTGYNNQQAVDVNKDGLSDLPDAGSVNIHPRLFYYPSSKTMISIGYNGSFDDRKGGDMLVLRGQQDAVHRYYESNNTQRHTGEYLAEQYFANNIKLTLKGNVSNFSRDKATDQYAVNGRQLSYYEEASVYAPLGKTDLVLGINAVGDNYQTAYPDTASLKTYGNATIGTFAQYDIHIREKTTIEGGLRSDKHNRYGFFVLPRVAVFHRFNEQWASRAGFGMGYKTPNPLVPQNIEYGVLDFLPLNNIVVPEMSYGYNAEVNYKKQINEHTSLFINQALFLTQVDRPILFVRNSAGKIDLANASAPIVSKGSDTYVKLKVSSWELYLGYTLTDARNTYLPQNTFVPLTPANRWAFVVVREIEEKWRFGLEGSYTGKQHRYDTTTTPPYFFMAIMVQRNIGKHIAIVLNCENLLDYRMSRVESLYNGTITDPAFKPLWAPIDGRVINLSLRWKL